MKFEEMLLKRESCRSYGDRPVSREDLLKICEAGRLTPSACNSQPWKFMVVDEADAKRKLCDALVVENGNSGAVWREDCPAFIVLLEQKANLVPMAMEHCQDSQWFARGDLGMASLNMCYQAMELGLSTCILGLVDQQKLHASIDIPEDQDAYVVVAVGYRKTEKPARTKIRKTLDEVVCINKWK